jgi:hypothetical protein
VCAIFSFGFLLLWCHALLSIVLLPLLQAERNIEHKDRILPMVRACLCVFFGFMVSIFISILVLGTGGFGTINAAIDALFVGIFLILLFATVGFRKLSLRLEEDIRPMLFQISMQLKEDLILVMRQMTTLRRQTTIGLLVTTVFALPFFITRQVLGYTPFGWVLFYASAFALQILVLAVTRTLFDTPKPMINSAVTSVEDNAPVVETNQDPFARNNDTSFAATSHLPMSSMVESSYQVVNEESPALLETGPGWKLNS